MIYKFFDTFHSFNDVMFDNYIILLKDIFNRFSILFVVFDGLETTMKMKIDEAMSHYALFLMMTPTCSEILSFRETPGIRVSRSEHISMSFGIELNKYDEENFLQRHTSMFVTQRKDSGEQKQRSFFELEEMIRNRSKRGDVAQEIRDNSLSVTPFNLPKDGLMSERTILNAMQLLDGICEEIKVNPDTRLPNVSGSFQDIKDRDQTPYMTFLNFICVEFVNLCQKKTPPLTILFDFSQLCSSIVPTFEFKERKKPVMASLRVPQSKPKSQPQPQPPQPSKYNQ